MRNKKKIFALVMLSLVLTTLAFFESHDKPTLLFFHTEEEGEIDLVANFYYKTSGPDTTWETVVEINIEEKIYFRATNFLNGNIEVSLHWPLSTVTKRNVAMKEIKDGSLQILRMKGVENSEWVNTNYNFVTRQIKFAKKLFQTAENIKKARLAGDITTKHTFFRDLREFNYLKNTGVDYIPIRMRVNHRR